MSSKKEAIEKARKDFGERYLKPLIILTLSAITEDRYVPQPDEIHFLLSKYFKDAGENPPKQDEVYKEIERLKKENMLK
jgi:hypothetical protein